MRYILAVDPWYSVKAGESLYDEYGMLIGTIESEVGSDE